MTSDFLSILYNKPLQEFRKTKFETGDKVRIWTCDLTSGSFFSHNLQKKFLKKLQFVPENLQYTQ